MTIAEVLRGAAEKLRTDGWCQYTVERDGKCCMTGAIKIASGLAPQETDWGNTDAEKAWMYMNDFLGQMPPRFNDDNHRTADDVIKALEDAASRCEVQS